MADASPGSVLDMLLATDDALGGASRLAALRAGRLAPGAWRLAEMRRLVAAQAQDSAAAPHGA
ncbi:MAG: hypothetical protein NTW56_09165 [Alphaproteobacteria bacterium]|nr:hypothetical protein [Alphaproteobacteria bacterium]